MILRQEPQRKRQNRCRNDDQNRSPEGMFKLPTMGGEISQSGDAYQRRVEGPASTDSLTTSTVLKDPRQAWGVGKDLAVRCQVLRSVPEYLL